MMTNNEKVKEFYTNDIVYRFDKSKKVVFGVVVDSYEGSSDVDEFNTLQKGQLRILWNNTSREQIWRQQKVRLLNRSIIPGDIVRRLEKDKETQRGYCKEIKQTATVLVVGTDKIIEHVSSERLKNIRSFQVDDAVCLGNQFGRIEAVEQMITMQSKCGSIVNVLTSINHELDDYWLSRRNKVAFESYHPGQEIICTPSNFEQPHWIRKSKAMKRNMQTRQRFTIQTVEDILIEISWYNNSSGFSHTTEITDENIKKLKVIEEPSDSCLELSERRLLKISAADTLQKRKDWIRKVSVAYRSEVPKVRHIVSCASKVSLPKVPKIRNPTFIFTTLDSIADEEEWWTDEGELSEENASSSSQGTVVTKSKRKYYPPRSVDLTPGNTVPVEIVCVESKITVVWQDGTEEKDIPSTQLYYSISLDDHEFFPGEWVINDNDKNESDKYGVIQNVNYLERTACIKWFKLPEEKIPKEIGMSECSVYDLKKQSKFVFPPGSIVKSKPAQEGKMGKVIDSCIEGYIKVRWLDGTEENCWPQDIEVLPDSGDFEYSDEESSDDDPAAQSWETESIESYAGDLTDETVLQSMAARLDFVRNRIIYLRDAFKNHTITENFSFLRDLLIVYENSTYLDKLLGTSIFSLKSKHFQTLLTHAKERAKLLGVELRGRLFSSDNLGPSISKFKAAEKENINKMIRLENKIIAQLEKKDVKDNPDTDLEKKGDAENPLTPFTPQTPECTQPPFVTQENLCLELLSMLKIRMDLAYAEIISRIGGNQAFSVLTKASETVPAPSTSTPLPSCPATPDESFSAFTPIRPKDSETKPIENEPYAILDEAPATHHYYSNKFESTDATRSIKAIQKEHKLLKSSLPPGVWVRFYANRIDLLSVMIRGPSKTPYEDGLFLFDIQLSVDYPRSPPLVHYISYSTERLNPNLYVEGKVCVSLLGTWMGRGTEVWGPNSTLLQLIVSIQGLILVSEPYYNEAGYEKQTDTQQGSENSRTYNELVILKLVQSMREMILCPPAVFKNEIIAHFLEHGQTLCDRLTRYCNDTDPLVPDFPLLPVSKGLKLSLTSSLQSFQDVLCKIRDKQSDIKENN